MRARRASRCTVCSENIQVGDEIEAFLGKWVHAPCKAADIARRAKSAGTVTVIPQDRFGNDSITYVGTRHWRRRGLKFLKNQQRP